MVNPINSNTSNSPVGPQQGTPAQPQPKVQQTPDPEDTVQLSRAAQKAGDADHDGDSH